MKLDRSKPWDSTPYGQVLRLALDTARVGQNGAVAQPLYDMLNALGDGRYANMMTTWHLLPPIFKALTGKPPTSRDDDV